MIMHCTFNTVNVLLSYADIENVPIWIALLVCVIAFAGFVVLTGAFFKAYSTEITVYQNKGRYKLYENDNQRGIYSKWNMCICDVYVCYH